MKKSNYIEQYKQLHLENKDYGGSSVGFLEEISLMIDHLSPKTVLDYGCGKGTLINALAMEYPEIEFFGYDPAIEGRDFLPLTKADLVINTDVLEHIPEEFLPQTLEEIYSISSNVYFNLHHGEAIAVLPNGENAHCTIKPSEWYHDVLKQYFGTVIPLRGQNPVLSVVITFNISKKIFSKYEKILAEKEKWSHSQKEKKGLAKMKRKIKNFLKKTFMR